MVKPQPTRASAGGTCRDPVSPQPLLSLRPRDYLHALVTRGRHHSE